MSEQDNQNKAIEQRADSISILKYIKYIILGATTSILALLTSTFYVLHDDHYLLKEIVKFHIEQLELNKDYNKRLNELSQGNFPLETRWNWPMQKVFADQLHQRNPALDVPPAKEIHEDGLNGMRTFNSN